jgi:hypothetical protein
MSNKRILALVLTIALLLSQSTSLVWAQGTEPSPKDEVVYASLDADGSVKGVYVVNEFKGGNIVDYGNYTKVRNLTTTDEIKQDGDKITVSTDQEKLHYQGDMENVSLPWNVKIKYYLDDIEKSPQEIAGATGHLKMKLDIT